MKKHICGLLAAIVLCTLVLSIPASAANTWGDNLTWEIDNKSTLTISGNGPMYHDTDLFPWYQCQPYRLIINEGCTSIAPKAFSYYHDELRYVTLPSTLTQIGEEAFYSCLTLTEINLEHVSVIGKQAFQNCYMLQEVHFSEKLQEIGYGAFQNCQQLKTVTFKNGVTAIGDHAFEKCWDLRAITIPGTVKYIGDSAFIGSGMKEIRFEGYPPKFNENAFKGISGVVYYPAGIPEWKEVATTYSNMTFIPFSCQSHTIATLPGRAPTCVQEGLTEGIGCTVCMLAETPQQVIPKEPHAYGAWITNGVSSTTDWVKKRICSTCGYEDILKPTLPEPTETTPIQESTEVTNATTSTTAPTSASSATAPTDNAPTQPEDSNDAKNAILFVIIGIVLLGLATSGIVFLKPKFTHHNDKNQH